MVKIAPSILSADFCNLERDMKRVSGADWLHVDVMDGMFVPNLTIGVPVVASIRKHTEMFLDVHLMIDKPARYIDQFCKAGADLLSVHLEADHPTRIADALRAMEANGVKKALALRPITSARAVLPYLERLDMVLVMTVEPGFGGQKFMEEQLSAIREVRALIDKYNPACELEVDGGIASGTAERVIEAGATVLVAGSAVYGADDPAAAIAALRQTAAAPISEQERQRRIRAIQGAEAINAIGGAPISDYARQLSVRWANGEITQEEMREALIERHRRIAEETRHGG